MTFDPGRIKRGLTSNEKMGPPIAEGRRYTLTHSDGTGDLFLSIGSRYDDAALKSMQVRLERDEVLAQISPQAPPPQVAAGMGGRSWDLSATIDRPAGAEGVLYASGTENSGLSVFIQGERLVFDFALAHKATPATLMYRGYRKATCTSINHVVCHGIPGDKVLKKGDESLVKWYMPYNR